MAPAETHRDGTGDDSDNVRLRFAGSGRKCARMFGMFAQLAFSANLTTAPPSAN
jgi:hypothetical protein